jgi:excisionase family DNA binding protein
MTESLLRLEEAARRLAVSERTTQRLLDQGRLPGVKVGGQWRIAPGQLEQWIAAGGDRAREERP